MLWLKRGGLFVPTTETYRLGNAICLLLSLPAQTERVSADGEVATHNAAMMHSARGFGSTALRAETPWRDPGI